VTPHQRDREWPPEPWQPPPLSAEDVTWLRTNLAPAEPLPTQQGPAPVPPPGPRGSRLNWWLKGPGIMVLIVVGGLILFVGYSLLPAVSPGPKYSARVVDCALDGRNAVASIELTNRGGSERTFEILIEYRDSGGARVDTDTAYAFNVPPGETVRLDESTHLNAEVASGVCDIVGVR
jgi:hypothetical protein